MKNCCGISMTYVGGNDFAHGGWQCDKCGCMHYNTAYASPVVINDSTSHITIGGGAGEQVKSIVKALRGLADALATLTD